jgi:hypothetical protein
MVDDGLSDAEIAEFDACTSNSSVRHGLMRWPTCAQDSADDAMTHATLLGQDLVLQTGHAAGHKSFWVSLFAMHFKHHVPVRMGFFNWNTA